ncbi:MAG TPA: SCP2 sterol-binding domain-containing protein [Longimicrobiaceae bacterium]
MEIGRQMEVFTEEWARACGEALNRSEAYRASAATWEGAIVLAMSADPAQGVESDRAVYIDAHQGACRGARLATADEADEAPFVFRADPASWKRMLAGEMEPVAAVMQGRLRLVRGNLFVLARYAQAAKDMVQAAATLGGTFPAPAASA